MCVREWKVNEDIWIGSNFIHAAEKKKSVALNCMMFKLMCYLFWCWSWSWSWKAEKETKNWKLMKTNSIPFIFFFSSRLFSFSLFSRFEKGQQCKFCNKEIEWIGFVRVRVKLTWKLKEKKQSSTTWICTQYESEFQRENNFRKKSKTKQIRMLQNNKIEFSVKEPFDHGSATHECNW